jgi:hypothetical protein
MYDYTPIIIPDMQLLYTQNSADKANIHILFIIFLYLF